MEFLTDIKSIESKILRLNPEEYTKNRNHTDGNVSLLSPYLTHGVISTNSLATSLIKRYGKSKSFTFIFELAWKEYFYKIWKNLGNTIEEDLQSHQSQLIHKQMVKNIYLGKTGITAIDNAIEDLYSTGYVHNHARMWIASLTCNVAKANWKLPAKWFYYHLLDGDIASNTLNWQLVAGTFESKKYLFNQASINKYSKDFQNNTFIDLSIKEIENLKVPKVLQEVVSNLDFTCTLPESQITEVDSNKTILLYSIWSIDPYWYKNKGNTQRILVLEPSHFNKYPISEKRVNFILNLAKNIEGILIYVGEVKDLKNLNKAKDVRFIEHPTINHWPGKKEDRDLIFKEVDGKFKSFNKFWEEAQEVYKVL